MFIFVLLSYLIISKMPIKRHINNDDDNEKNQKKTKYDITPDQFEELFNKIKKHFEYARATGAPVALVETEDQSKILLPNKPYAILERNGKNIHTCIQKIFGDVLVNKESECGSENDCCYLHDDILVINKTKWSFWNIHTNTRLVISDKQMHQIVEHSLFSGINKEDIIKMFNITPSSDFKTNYPKKVMWVRYAEDEVTDIAELPYFRDMTSLNKTDKYNGIQIMYEKDKLDIAYVIFNVPIQVPSSVIKLDDTEFAGNFKSYCVSYYGRKSLRNHNECDDGLKRLVVVRYKRCVIDVVNEL